MNSTNIPIVDECFVKGVQIKDLKKCPFSKEFARFFNYFLTMKAQHHVKEHTLLANWP